MAFIAVPIVLSGLSGLGYYFLSAKEEKKDETKLLEVGTKYSSVLNELKSEPKHPILQKLEVKQEFAPTLQEIKNKKAELKHVDLITSNNNLTLMQQFVIALNNRKNTLKKLT